MIEVKGKSIRMGKRLMQGNRLVYIHVPRTGGSSLNKAFKACKELEIMRERLPHQLACDYHREFKVKNTVLIATMREPHDWIESQWALVQDPKHKPVDGGPAGHTYYDRWPSFEDYVRNHCLEYMPWRFQSDFILKTPARYNRDQGPVGWELGVKRLYNFNRIDDLWNWVEIRLGVKLKRLHINAAKRPKKPVWSKELKEFFAEAYKRDLELYDRQFGTDPQKYAKKKQIRAKPTV